MCRAFPTTLRGLARIWFSKLMPNSISTFNDLSAQFASHFIEGHRYKKLTTCLMSIRQREDETLRSYIARFNKEALLIGEANDKILVAAFMNELRKGKFIFSLYKNDPKTMSDVLYRATKYMNAEDTLLAHEENPKKRERQEEARQDRASPKDSYPLPQIDTLVDSSARHQLLSFIDAFSGYNQIKMKEVDQEKTSFVTSQGLFCYKVMPFRLKNAGATYQRLMNKMFAH